VVWFTIEQLAADYFLALMAEYNISPDATHRMFLGAIRRYLVQATIAAIAIAGFLSYILTRKALRPLSQMTEITRRVAAGDYGARVETSSADEVGRLGAAFNQMADSLERVETLRKTMVSDLAHELRTPLTNIRGYLEGLTDQVVPPSRETYRILEQEILRLVRLVESLQQLTQIDAARAYLKREPIDLAHMVDQVLAMNRTEFESREIAVETDFPDGVGHTVGDRDRMFQVLRNLVENAWQYTPQGGRFRIAAKRIAGQGQAVRVEFVNNGGGLSRDDLGLIFERFYRADKSRSRDSGGAGIGLAIVKDLIEAHGGEVGADSDAAETRFWFILPG
jgi:signal transduction histidine kinase